MQIKQIIASAACGVAMMFGGFAAASAQGLTEIGSASGVGIDYTGSTLILTGDPTGTYSTHMGSSIGSTYSNVTETFYSSTTGSSSFTSLGGTPTSTAGENFGGGYFTITQGNTTLLGGTFDDLTFNEYGGGNGDIDLDGIDYFGSLFPNGYNPDASANDGSLTFNYPSASGGDFSTTDASTYSAVPNGAPAVPEMSPAAIVGLGALALLGLFGLQGRSRRMGRVSA